MVVLQFLISGARQNCGGRNRRYADFILDCCFSCSDSHTFMSDWQGTSRLFASMRIASRSENCSNVQNKNT
jgi:hypothetical protein